MIETSVRTRLLGLAAAAIDARVRRYPAPAVPPDLDVAGCGAFVTVRCHGELRGCLGTLESSERLAVAVARLGADVTHRDYRFNPLRVDELDRVELEISVLTYPALADPAEIIIGRDGVIVEQGRRKGLLLPQVAPEHGWDRETLLEHACLKAGLPRDAWRRGATVYRFEAEVFGSTMGEALKGLRRE